MGYYVISNYIPFGGIRIKKLKPPQKRKDKYMSKENAKKTINTIKHLDSMKAVKVAYDLTSETMTSMETLARLVKNNTDNLNLLATKVLELEQRLNVASKAIERIDELETKEYERDLNERSKSN